MCQTKGAGGTASQCCFEEAVAQPVVERLASEADLRKQTVELRG
jgi:hypothetical protein